MSKKEHSKLEQELRFMLLKKYGLIKSMETDGISRFDLELILKKSNDNEIKRIAAKKLKIKSGFIIRENIELFQKWEHGKGMAPARARQQARFYLSEYYYLVNKSDKALVDKIIGNE